MKIWCGRDAPLIKINNVIRYTL